MRRSEFLLKDCQLFEPRLLFSAQNEKNKPKAM